MENTDVEIHTTLTRKEAWQLAQFLKRCTFGTWMEYVNSGQTYEEKKEQAYIMRDACEKVRSSLADAGYSPR